MRKGTYLKRGRFRIIAFLAHIINVVAVILLTTGLSRFPTTYTFNPYFEYVDSVAKAGAYLQCILTALIMVLCLYRLLLEAYSLNITCKIIIRFVLLASLPMAMRTGYWTYRLQINRLFRNDIWVYQVVFHYTAEVIAVIIFVILGHRLSKARRNISNVDRGTPEKEGF